jgi:hypothetical protein
MSGLEIYAFFIAPLLLVALGSGAAWLHLWDLKRRDRQHPAE